MNTITGLFIAINVLLLCSCSDEEHINSNTYTATELAGRADVKKIKDYLNNYATGLATNSKNNIFEPKIIEDKPFHFIVEFQTSDPHLMLKDVDKDPKAYDRNNAMNAAWESKFCSQELKSIIINHSANHSMIIEGRVLDSKQKGYLATQAIAKCDGSNATTIEIMDRGIQDNLNSIQYMSDKMDSWKR